MSETTKITPSTAPVGARLSVEERANEVEEYVNHWDRGADQMRARIAQALCDQIEDCARVARRYRGAPDYRAQGMVDAIVADIRALAGSSLVLKAEVITSQTLIGYSLGPYPMKRGNCFSVEVDGGGEYRVVNFGLENLREMIARGMISWPIDIQLLNTTRAVMADPRIPAEWYSDYCLTCWPISARTQAIIDRTLDEVDEKVSRAGELIGAAHGEG
jgi:hypothetical protein